MFTHREIESKLIQPQHTHRVCITTQTEVSVVLQIIPVILVHVLYNSELFIAYEDIVKQRILTFNPVDLPEASDESQSNRLNAIKREVMGF